MLGPELPYLPEAACRDEDPAMFTGGDAFDLDEPTERELAPALAVCVRCPALWACFDYAMTHAEWGIWAGTTARQRQAYRHMPDVLRNRIVTASASAALSDQARYSA